MKICPKCRKEHEKPGQFCSRTCANSRTFSPESIKKKSEANKRVNRDPEFSKKRVERAFQYWKDVKSGLIVRENYDPTRVKAVRPKRVFRPSSKGKICPMCEKAFTLISGEAKYCSDICRSLRSSLVAQKRIQRYGFTTKRETFTYKDVTIEVDSHLEKAGIVYLVDYCGAISVERYRNIVNFEVDGKHKTFNPDFFVTTKDAQGIAEVKQLWVEGIDHPYNRYIPQKKAKLQEYCVEKRLKLFWIDFSTAPELKKIYRGILKNGR